MSAPPLDIQAIKAALGIEGFTTTENILDAIDGLRKYYCYDPPPPPPVQRWTPPREEEEPLLRRHYSKPKPCPFAEAVKGGRNVPPPSAKFAPHFARMRAAAAGQLVGDEMLYTYAGRVWRFVLVDAEWVFMGCVSPRPPR